MRARRPNWGNIKRGYNRKKRGRLRKATEVDARKEKAHTIDQLEVKAEANRSTFWSKITHRIEDWKRIWFVFIILDHVFIFDLSLLYARDDGLLLPYYFGGVFGYYE